MPGSRRLSTYVHGELLTSTLLSIALWTAVLLMNRFFLIAGEALQRDLTAATTLRLFLLFVPNSLVLAIPMGTILGTLVAVGRLSADQEVLAIESAGQGPSFFARTVALHGLVLTAAALVLYGWVHPWASYEIRKMRSEFLSASAVAGDLRPRIFYQNLPGVVLFVDDRLPGEREEARGILLYQQQPGTGAEQLFVARRGRILDTGGAGSLAFELEDGILHVYQSQKPETYRPTRFDRFRPPPVEVFSGASRRAGQEIPVGVTDMTVPRLTSEIETARAEADPIIRTLRVRGVLTEIHSRFALPFACFFFALLALPLGVTRARSGKGAGFALSLAIILMYWLVYTYSRQDLAIEGTVHPAVAIWSANALTAAWALVAILRMGRPERSRFQRVRGFVEGVLSRLRPRAERSLPETGESSEARTATSEKPWYRRISLVDAYVVRTYLKVFLLAVGATYLIFALVEVRDVLEGVLRGGHPLRTLFQYYVYFTPGALRIVVPIACLIGATVACTLLSRTSEVTALKAAGMSIRRISRPILLVTCVVGLAHFLVQDRIAPESNRRAQQIKDEFQGRAPRTYGIAAGGRWTFGTEGRLYHYRLYDAERRTFQGLSTFRVRFDPPAILEHGFALTAKWSEASGSWEAERGWVRTFPAGRAGTFRTYDLEPLPIDPPDHFERRERSMLAGNEFAEWLGVRELHDEIRALEGSGYDTTRLRVAYHRQIAEVVVPLVMVVLGLPFAFRVGRRGSLYGVGVALLLVLLYWATWAIANGLGLQDVVPPAIAAWGPNVLWAAVGSFLLLTARS